jgi:hypothetical protein
MSSTVGTIAHRTSLTGTNRTDVQVSKMVWNDTLVVASAAPDGATVVRDSTQADGWGFRSDETDPRTSGGAVGDGVTDDTLALRAAITAAGVGGTLRFPAGKTFLLSGRLVPLAGQTWRAYGATLKRSNQVSTATSTNIAAGPSSTAITVTSAAGFSVGMDVTVFNGASYDPANHAITAIVGNVITVGTVFSVAFPAGGTLVSSSILVYSAQAAQVAILGLTVDGNKANNTLLTQWENHKELDLDGDRSVVRDCYVHDAQAEGITIGGISPVVDHCWVEDCNGNGIHFSGSTDGRATGNYVHHTNLGGAGVGHNDGGIIFSNSTGDSIIAENYIDTGIASIGSIDSDANSSVVITGNICKNATTFAIDMNLPNVNAGKVVIAHNLFYDCAPLTIKNNNSSPTANTGPYRVSVAGNYFENTRLDVTRAFDITITGNTIVSLTDTTNILITLYDPKRCLVTSNLVRGGNYGVYLDGTAGQLPESVVIAGNVFHNQTTGAIRSQIATTTAITIQGNTVQTDAAYAAAGYSGIWASNGVSVLNNVLDLQSGQYGVLCPNGGASTQGAIVAGNVIRSAVTASIRTNGGSQKNLLTNNFVQQAISDAGSPNNTVTGTLTIL